MNIDQAEKDKFNKIAEEWWDPSGKFAPLHKINPLRSNYINDKKNVNNLEVLDVACGGGLLAEALYDFGAQVTGVEDTTMQSDFDHYYADHGTAEPLHTSPSCMFRKQKCITESS